MVGAKWFAVNAPNTAPTTVPMNRCFETSQEAPGVDCVTMIVEIDAQYASGIPKTLVTANETAAATTVRSEWTVPGSFQIYESRLVLFGCIMRTPIS